MMSHKDAAMFPLVASAALFGLYIVFQVTNLFSSFSHDHFHKFIFFIFFSDFFKGIHKFTFDFLLFLLRNFSTMPFSKVNSKL